MMNVNLPPLIVLLKLYRSAGRSVCQSVGRLVFCYSEYKGLSNCSSSLFQWNEVKLNSKVLCRLLPVWLLIVLISLVLWDQFRWFIANKCWNWPTDWTGPIDRGQCFIVAAVDLHARRLTSTVQYRARKQPFHAQVSNVRWDERCGLQRPILV